MKNRILKLVQVLTLLLVVILMSVMPIRSQEIPSPESHFGFQPGTDNMLFDYAQLIEYFKKLDNASDKIEMREIGISPMGRKMYVAFISSAENIAKLDRLKEINKELALNYELTDQQVNDYVEEGKAFLMFTLSMHSTEVAPAQASPLIAYDLIKDEENKYSEYLEDVVYMVVPNHNPDGMDMVVNHYNKYKGTKYDGASMPGLYHKYVGHDNNRDFIILSQTDTRAIAKLYNTEWYPHVMIEKHQMGSRGPRYFVSPPHDPIAENIDAGLWNWMKVFGSRAVSQMTEEGLKGVSHSYIFDDYWPGATETCIWKGVVGMLTEMASVKYATPIYIEPSELRAGGKGLGEYAKSINMPDPWEGGWWKLSKMVEYEHSNTMSYLETGSTFKDDLLKFRNELTQKEVKRGLNEAPYYYILPADQHDKSELVEIINLLDEHGVNVYQLNQNVEVGNITYKQGDIVVPLSQPYRAFIKEVLEVQVFPERHYTPNGELIRPYDITSWSLPLHKGLSVVEINASPELFKGMYDQLSTPFTYMSATSDAGQYVVLSANSNDSYKAVFFALANNMVVEQATVPLNIQKTKFPSGSFIIQLNKNKESLLDALNTTPMFVNDKPEGNHKVIQKPRIALVESWFHDMDAGWTRYVFDSYNVDFTVIRPADIEKTDFRKNYDMIIFPDVSKSVLMKGKYGSEGRYYTPSYPPEYAKGMGKKGLDNIFKFINDGGKVLSWRRSSELFIGPQSITLGENKKEEFQLPVRKVESGGSDRVYVPGSLLRISLKEDHPLTYGLPDDIGVFHRGNPIFATSQPIFDMDRRIIASFPKDENDILMSGYGKNLDKLENKAAMVWLKKGKGQLILYSFNPQFRASTPGSYKLLFNAIFL